MSHDGRMKILEEFRAFIMRGNIFALAIAFVIGTAFTKFVEATTATLITPLLGMLIAGKGFEILNWKYLYLGSFLQAAINFVILAGVVFFVFVKPMTRLGLLPPEEKKDVPPPPPPPPSNPPVP